MADAPAHSAPTRASVALWFAMAGLVASLIGGVVLGLFQEPPMALMIIGSSFIGAWCAGAVLGLWVMQAHAWWAATLKGVLVALFAYLPFSASFALMLLAYSRDSGDILQIFQVIFMIIWFGFLVTFYVVLPVGAISGALIWRMHNRQD